MYKLYKNIDMFINFKKLTLILIYKLNYRQMNKYRHVYILKKRSLY